MEFGIAVPVTVVDPVTAPPVITGAMRGVEVAVGVIVGVFVGVLVAVFVPVAVDVAVAVTVGVGVDVGPTMMLPVPGVQPTGVSKIGGFPARITSPHWLTWRGLFPFAWPAKVTLTKFAGPAGTGVLHP